MRETRDVYREMFEGIKWIWTEIIEQESRTNAKKAICFLIAAMFTLMFIPYTWKFVADAMHAGQTNLALLWLVFGTGGAGLSTVALISLHDHYRERAWNSNYSSVVNSLVRKLYERILEELLGDGSEVGAEQIESTKDKVENILYMLLFESPQVLASITPAIIFMGVVDWRAGLVAFGLLVLNVLWFLYFNTRIDEKMGDLDEQFRTANRRMVEKMYFAYSVKAAGVEQKMQQQIAQEVAEPLMADLKIWAYWFIYVESVRKGINYVTPVLFLGYGIYSELWTVGDFLAIAAWFFLLTERFGLVGHFMRHLTANVARIKATREKLSKPSLFHFNKGTIYERSS
ncbi:MAG: hypothetical protein WDZ93_02140 [Candidatus Paceibacterota bacterium]